jgi:hypothetical protein
MSALFLDIFEAQVQECIKQDSSWHLTRGL